MSVLSGTSHCTYIMFSFNDNYTLIVSPHEMGRHIVLAPLYVCLYVRPSVRLSVRHTFVSALYLLNPWWDLQITLHMSSMMRRCAVPMFDQGRFKVKVTILD